MAMLTDLSQALAETVEKAGTSVVRVDGRRRLPASGIVWNAEGVIITSHHVLESDEGIQVGFPNGETVPAELVGRDHTTDLAVLRAQTGGVGAPHRMKKEEIGREIGLLLVSVEPESPAEKGGLILGDVIIGIEGDPVQSLDDLMGGLGGERVGESTQITVLRGGVVKQVSVVPGERPEWRPKWKRGSRG